MNKHEEKKDGRENILLRFFAVLGVLALMLALTAGSCDKKKKADGKGGPGPNKDDNNEVDCTQSGFTVKFANDSHKKAFDFGSFTTEAESTSNVFVADLKVKLSQLTQANGFVSNHVWIHTDKAKYAMPFEEVGILANTLDDSAAVFEAGAKPIAEYDFKFCGFGTGAAAANYKATVLNNAKTGINADFVWEGFNPTKLDGSLDFSTYNTTDVKANFDLISDDNTAEQCADGFRYGDVLEVVSADEIKKGKLRVGYKALPAGGNFTEATMGAETDNFIKWNEEYEKAMDMTGAYYVRDSFAYKFVKEGTDEDAPDAAGDVPVPFVKEVKHVHENDTDLFYEEVKRAFEGAGAAMANLATVFDADMNMGIGSNFTRQPAAKGADNKSTPFDSPWMKSDGAVGAGGLGTSENGGWQKLFTITPCDAKMTNGIALAYNLGADDDAKKWKDAPELMFDGETAFDNSLEKNVIIRRGGNSTEKTQNNHALLIESMVSPKYIGNNNLGFFTIQHGGTDAMTDAKNAFSTKGVIHCRSAVAIADDGTKDDTKGAKIAENIIGASAKKEDVAKYANKLQGYNDGKIGADEKGLGLTCYLGLSALWPDAVDGADKLKGTATVTTAPHKVQFDKTDNKDANKYDYAKKNLGLLMINMPEDVAMNHKLLLPIFNQFSTDGADDKAGAKKKMEKGKDVAKSVLKDIKADDMFGYLHGNVVVTFSKE